MENPHLYYNRIASFYDEMFSRKIDKAEDELIYAYLKKYSHLITLDLGCGTGTFAEKIDPIMYVGIDISQNMIEEGIAKVERLNIANCSFFRRPMEDINLKHRKGKFGLVVSNHCSVGHTDLPKVVASNIESMLAPGGVFFLMLPTEKYISGYNRRAQRETLRAYKREDLEAIFGASAGLKIARAWSFNCFLDGRFGSLFPKFFLKLLLIMETKFFGKSNRGKYIILEGYKPLKPIKK